MRKALPAQTILDDITFAVIIELKDDAVPTVSHTKVRLYLPLLQAEMVLNLKIHVQDPPPWIPAEPQNTTSGTSDDAELHMLRAVNTGIINVRTLVSAQSTRKADVFLQLSVAVQESGDKLQRMKDLSL